MILIFSKHDPNIKSEIELLKKIKETLKSNDVALEICKEYGYKPDIIDGIPISFGKDKDIDASARTVNSHIQLNEKLKDADFADIMRYAVHELVHALQHMEKANEAYDNMEYLDRPDEVEAFQYQVKFEDSVKDSDEVEKYVDDLLEYHEVPNNKQEKKKEELLEKID